MPDGINAYIKDHDCEDHIEKLYYGCGDEACCIQCGYYPADVDDEQDTYPQCEECDMPPIPKRR